MYKSLIHLLYLIILKIFKRDLIFYWIQQFTQFSLIFQILIFYIAINLVNSFIGVKHFLFAYFKFICFRKIDFIFLICSNLNHMTLIFLSCSLKIDSWTFVSFSHEMRRIMGQMKIFCWFEHQIL
jgi:hypothetical protein